MTLLEIHGQKKFHLMDVFSGRSLRERKKEQKPTMAIEKKSDNLGFRSHQNFLVHLLFK